MLEGVGLEVLCYVVLLLMPILGRMSDQLQDVRLMATKCFGNLVTLMPLEVGLAVVEKGIGAGSCRKGGGHAGGHAEGGDTGGGGEHAEGGDTWGGGGGGGEVPKDEAFQRQCS